MNIIWFLNHWVKAYFNIAHLMLKLMYGVKQLYFQKYINHLITSEVTCFYNEKPTKKLSNYVLKQKVLSSLVNKWSIYI